MGNRLTGFRRLRDSQEIGNHELADWTSGPIDKVTSTLHCCNPSA
jgi:hypothetical protein